MNLDSRFSKLDLTPLPLTIKEQRLKKGGGRGERRGEHANLEGNILVLVSAFIFQHSSPGLESCHTELCSRRTVQISYKKVNMTLCLLKTHWNLPFDKCRRPTDNERVRERGEILPKVHSEWKPFVCWHAFSAVFTFTLSLFPSILSWSPESCIISRLRNLGYKLGEF